MYCGNQVVSGREMTVPEAVSEPCEAFFYFWKSFLLPCQVSEYPEDDGHRRGQQQSPVREEQQHGGGSRRCTDRSAVSPPLHHQGLHLYGTEVISFNSNCACLFPRTPELVGRPRLPRQSTEDQPPPPITCCKIHYTPRILHCVTQ